MKKILLALVVALFVAAPVRAEDGGAATRIKQLREENKAKIQEIRSQKKKDLVKKIDIQLCQLKKNRTASMGRQIENLTKIVTRVEASGKADATKLAEVKTALSEAKAAVDALASENCGVQITGTDTTVKREVKQSVLEAKDEWKAAFAKIEAVKKLLRELVTSTKVK